MRALNRHLHRSARAGASRLAMALGALLSVAPWSVAAEPTPQAYRQDAVACLRKRNLDCAQKNWEAYLRLRPDDANAAANLGIVMNRRDDHQGAIKQFERAIDLGEGTYDLFALYADSLGKVGRIDDAIDWSYKALVVVPRLVDVRSSLAKLLVLQKRHFEALAVLSSHDAQQAITGRPPYFEGQRIAIESALSRVDAASGTETKALRLAKTGDHFYAPVTVGEARPAGFVVDTGATVVALDDAYLESSKAVYKVVGGTAPMKTADGRTVTGRRITMASLRVGPWELKNVPAFACKGCAPLLGQSALSRFDMSSTKTQGVEFLTLSARRSR